MISPVIKLYLYLVSFTLALTTFSFHPETTAPKTHTVEIKQMMFQPAELVVNKGDKVVFINKDVLTHDVTEASGKSWKSPALTSGKTWSKTITTSSAYYCSYHPVMKGKISVK